MNCHACGAENPADQKFCNECAAPFKKRCTKCGYENAPNAKFCGDCAAALISNVLRSSAPTSSTPSLRVAAEQAGGSSFDGERKTVTALFADIKGSTELMEDLDPEEARAIVDPALKLMIDAVRRYDGYVVQSTGDGIFALFGAPVAHEDHPQRALYAALRLQEELKRYSDRMRLEGKLPLQARVGANTGEVVVRSIETGDAHTEYTPIGHTANLASRMQVLAPIGSIAATDQVRKLCEGYFLFNGLGPTKVTGVSAPVNVYEVTGLGPLRTRLQRAAGRGLTKFVGREREMQALKHAAEQAMGGHGQIAAAMAEAGVGKSRLFFEFKATSQSGWMVLETFSISHGKASAYLPVIDLLRNYFDISLGDDERKRREKVAGKIAILDRSLEDTLPYLFSLLGIVEGYVPLALMDGQIKKRRTLDAIKRIVLRESLNQPLMLIFEDLHWIDEQTQELLNLLADSIGTAKILLLVNYRPEYSHQWGSKTYYTQLRLDPLGKESAEEMLSALLGDGKDLLPLRRLIIERTEGTPFFMEEMVQVLFEDGVLQRNGTVKLARSMNAVKVPATVQAVLAARIDRLPADEKELLQTLAVIGREFALSLVRRMVDENDDDLERMLADLQMAEFIYEQPAVGDTEYIFKHALTQEVAYNSVLIERRKQLHERIGGALETLYASSLNDHLSKLAHHYGRGNNLDKAVDYLGRASRQAVSRSAFNESQALLQKALEWVQRLPESPERDTRELTLQLALGRITMATRGLPSADTGAVYARARILAERTGAAESLEVFSGLWGIAITRGEMRAALVLADQVLGIARGLSSPQALVTAHFEQGVSRLNLGDLAAARPHLAQAIERYREEDFSGIPDDHGVNALVWAGFNEWLLGYPDQALRYTDDARSLARRLNKPFALAYASIGAWTEGLCGDFARARAASQEVERLSTELGFPMFRALSEILAAWARAHLGEMSDAVDSIRVRLAEMDAINFSVMRGPFLALLGETQAIAGAIDDAIVTVGQALVTNPDESWCRPLMLLLRGELHLRTNTAGGAAPLELAEHDFREAIEVAKRMSAKSWELRATMSLARQLRDTGHRDEAGTMLAEIYNWFTEGFDTADLKDAKALLEELRGTSE
jgi:class 3 adenylate cyclase/tetratricopeptide (TPR) repeat protein